MDDEGKKNEVKLLRQILEIVSSNKYSFVPRRYNDFSSIENIIIREFGNKYTLTASEINSEIYCLYCLQLIANFNINISSFDLENAKFDIIGTLVSGKNLKMIVNLSNKEFDRALFNKKESNYAWFTTKNRYELAEYLPASSTIYRREKDSSKKYLDKYLQILSEANVSMRDINTEEQILEFVISKKPEPNFLSINSEIEIRSFYAAEGNEYIPQGFEGSTLILIKVINSEIENDTAREQILIKISPIPYKEEEKLSEEESTDGSEEETTDNNQETTDNEEESTENKPDETTDSSQEEETSSNNNKNVIKLYFEQVLQSIPDEISMKEVNTEEEASAYVKGFFDETLIDKYKLDISIESFRGAEKGTMLYPSG